jgi:hypothetical protein
VIVSGVVRGGEKEKDTLKEYYARGEGEGYRDRKLRKMRRGEREGETEKRNTGK